MDSITNIDKNLASSMAKPVIHDGERLLFYDIKNKPFEIFGLYDACKSAEFRRLPSDIAAAVSGGVEVLSRHTAGARLRFATDSKKIVLKVRLKNWSPMPHMTPTGIYGFDAYTTKGKTEVLAGIFGPPTDGTLEYERELCFDTKENREVTVNFPLYNEVERVEVGLLEGSTLGAHKPYSNEKPVLFYGSSITQGGCASRPGMCYENIISRELNMDYVNLGFSGSALGEPAIVDYMASLDICAFVCDYDHNAPSPEHLKKTHYNIYEKMRGKHSDIPIILVSRPSVKVCDFDAAQRRAVIMETFSKGIGNGDRNLYFVDGAAFFAGASGADYTVDSTHPTDLGFSVMAQHIGRVLEAVL